MSNSQKTSQFTVLQTLLDSALITVVSNGQNFTIPFSDFKNALGVTGTLSTEGDALGTPILLEPSAGDFKIRNLEASKGIIASASPENGALLANNFFQSTGGQAVIEDLSADEYKIRTLKAIAPLQIIVDGDSLVFSDTGSPVAATNTVIVSTIDDFPTPIGGAITLDDDINYIIVQAITTSNRFILGANNSITSNNPLSPLFTYTGTGTFFTGVDVNLTIHSIFLNAPNGQVFDMSSTGTGNFFLATLVIVLSCNKYATFNDLRTVDVVNSSALSVNEGITVLGNTNWNIFSFSKFSLITASASFIGIDLGTSVHNTLELTNFIVRGVSGAIAIKGATGSANINVNQLATVNNSEFTGGVTILSGISEDDIRWFFQGNTGIEDTRPDGLASIFSNALETVITASSSDGSNAVKMNGVWTIEGSSHFTVDSAGRITYDGEKNFTAPLDVTVNVLMASGGTKNISAYLNVNGTIKRATEGPATPTSSLKGSCICHWQHTFEPGNWIEVWLENQSDTVNIIGASGVLRVN